MISFKEVYNVTESSIIHHIERSVGEVMKLLYTASVDNQDGSSSNAVTQLPCGK
jgi:hypothetical protein